MRHVSEIEPHLDARQRAHQHQVVEVSDMADPEQLALDLVEPGAERHVEILQHHFAEIVRVVALGHHHAGEPGECACGSWHWASRPQTFIAARVAALWRLWRANTFSRPSSSSILTAS